MEEAKTNTLIFTYGTLKRHHANHHLIQSLASTNDAVYLGPYTTSLPHPLVLGPYNIPYLINIPGSGNRVKGELYSVSGKGLVRLDELEGVSFGHYERLPLEVVGDENGDVLDAQGYFGHRSFGERLWERKGRDGGGLSEYGEEDGGRYVRIRDRPKGCFVLDDLEAFIGSSN